MDGPESCCPTMRFPVPRHTLVEATACDSLPQISISLAIHSMCQLPFGHHPFVPHNCLPKKVLLSYLTEETMSPTEDQST